MDVAVAVDLEAGDHTVVADSRDIRASGVGWVLNRAEHPAQLGEAVDHAVSVKPFPGDDPGVVDRRRERAERRRERIADRGEPVERPAKATVLLLLSV